jgi:glycerol-3-phosphate dehydrogenase
MRRIGTEILVIGGGATGAGVALDASMRGFKTMLVEKGDLSHGTTGRYHGLLHSGARYAVRDPGTARECIVENRLLRRLMPEAIEDTGGLFMLLPDDDPAYADRWVMACKAASIPVEEIPLARALAEEPLLNPKALRVFRVPDAACDSFDALHMLARGIRACGGTLRIRHRVEAFLVESNRVRGARVRDLREGEEIEIRAELVVNAAGPWAGQMAAMAGIDLRVEPSKGTLLAYAHRLTHTVLNRCAMPGDGDILVPVGTVSVIGTTSVHVDDPDVYEIEPWEVELLKRRGEELIPAAREARFLRAWAGARPLFQEEAPAGDERAVTRAHAVIDHATRDGIGRFVSVVGGKFTTYRLMAEEAVDLVCQKLGAHRPCHTAEEPLPARPPRHYHVFNARYARIDKAPSAEGVLCECELVTRNQLAAAIRADDVVVLSDLRRELRLGMGPCQGAFCGLRAAGVLREIQALAPKAANAALLDFLQARWKGIRPIATGHTARQAALNIRLYRDLLGLDRLPREGETEPYPTERTS